MADADTRLVAPRLTDIYDGANQRHTEHVDWHGMQAAISRCVFSYFHLSFICTGSTQNNTKKGLLMHVIFVCRVHFSTVTRTTARPHRSTLVKYGRFV
jgi:hypothetical protein